MAVLNSGPPSAVESIAFLKKGEPIKENTSSLFISLLFCVEGTEVVSLSSNYYQTRKQESFRVNWGTFARQTNPPKNLHMVIKRTNHRTRIHVGIMKKRQLNPRLVDLSAESFTPR